MEREDGGSATRDGWPALDLFAARTPSRGDGPRFPDNHPPPRPEELESGQREASRLHGGCDQLARRLLRGGQQRRHGSPSSERRGDGNRYQPPVGDGEHAGAARSRPGRTAIPGGGERTVLRLPPRSILHCQRDAGIMCAQMQVLFLCTCVAQIYRMCRSSTVYYGWNFMRLVMRDRLSWCNAITKFSEKALSCNPLRNIGTFGLKIPLHVLDEHIDIKTELYQTKV